MKKSNYIFRFFIIISFLSFLLQGCSNIRLISDYDEITDVTVNNLQRNVSAFFVKMERTIGTDSAKYENNIAFYDDAKVDLDILSVRAKAFEKNGIVEKQVKALSQMFSDLESLHKIGFVDASQIEPLKQPFNSAFTAIIKLQMALKRGDGK
ncbi:MAG: hypothetical protein HGGPFJEG_00582 [Ignavibacteria bacterium]|nr:hypothetical protein [Ignavibacteria bacterium]